MGWWIYKCNSTDVPYQVEFHRADKGNLVQVGVMLWCVAGVFLLLGTPGPANGAPPPQQIAQPADTLTKPEASPLEPAQVLRGMPVKVSGTGFDQATEIRVRLNEKELLLDKPRGDDAKSFTFRIPPEFPLGRYTVRVVFFRKEQPPLIEGVPVPSQNNESIEKLGIRPLQPAHRPACQDTTA